MQTESGGDWRGMSGRGGFDQAAGPAVDRTRPDRVGGIARGKAVDGDREEQD